MSFRRHLVRWEAEYACELEVVEVSGGATAEFEPSRRLFARWELGHPGLWDHKNTNAKAYGVSAWPSAFLIGRDGTVFWQGNPGVISRSHCDELEFRALLEDHLRRAAPTGR